jgi:hypothetical protein
MKFRNYILLSLVVSSFFIQACEKSASVSNLTPDISIVTSPEIPAPPSTPAIPTSPAATTENTCSAPTTTVIWKGERSTAATVAVRGAWSDIKVIPGTTFPASVYTDVGCSCLRYTFWNGTGWSTEIISAASSTSFTHIRLAFLNTGIPVVVWSNSTTILQIAIRDSASVSVEGTWTVSNLDIAGTAIRAVEIKVNPSNQVAILYARNTAGTSHLILCSSGCQLVGNYSSPSTTLGTVGANPHSLGLGWCSSGSAYYPVVAITGATNSTYAVCRQTTLSSCLTGIASWAGGALQTLTGSGANRTVVQLAMDDTTTDAPVRAVLSNGAALAYYQSSFVGGGCATGTIGAIASGGTISGTTANSGNAYLEVQRVSGNNYHLIANEALTAVRYYNTTTGSFTTWNAAGTIATTTLGAAGATRGGLAVDTVNGQAYTTYARTAAVTPYNGNLMFGFVENITVASNGATAEYYETPLTIDGQLQMTVSQVPNLATASTSAGIPATAFVDYSSNSATVGVLRFGMRSGSAASDEWNIRTVPISAQPQSVALIFDTNNKPWIGFFDQLTLRFLLATNSETDGTGTWSTYYFPFRTAVTAATAPAFHSVALAMDRTASVVTPVMIVGIANHATIANTGVWAAKLISTTGNWANMAQIDSTNLANSVSNVTADYDASGNIVVAYYDRSASNRLEYAHSVNAGATWSAPTQVTALTASGMGAKIKLNPTTSKPAITYFDRANNRVFYSYCSSVLSGCSSLVNWSYSIVENLTAGVSGLAATSDGLLATGLTFSNTGKAYVQYPIGAGNSGVLALNTNASGTFGNSTILVTGKNANTLSNTTISPINFAQPGWGVDAVRTTTGALHSIHIGPGNWLYATSCGD